MKLLCLCEISQLIIKERIMDQYYKKVYLILLMSVLCVSLLTAGELSMKASGEGYSPAALDRFEITGLPDSIQAGQQFPDTVTVTAYDIYNNIISDYSGLITWSSSDSHSKTILPTDDGTDWNNGTKKFYSALFKLCTTNSQWIIVADGPVSSTQGPIEVTPAVLDSFSLGGIPVNKEAGHTFVENISVTAFDLFGNVKDDYEGTVEWISTDGSPYPAELPDDDGTGWSSGQKSFSGSSFVLYNAPSQTITVKDGSVNETSNLIEVFASDLNSLVLSGVPSSVHAGSQFTNNVTVTAFDMFNNLKKDYTGLIEWSSSDLAPYPAALPVDNGAGWQDGHKNFSGSSFILFNSSSRTITAKDGDVTVTSTSITVLAGELGDFTISGVPESRFAGQNFSYGVTVIAYDDYGNQKSDYYGLITWSSSDTEPYPASLPLDNGSGWSDGMKTFFGSSFTLYNAPYQTITVSDGDISETSNIITIFSSSVNSFTLNCGYVQKAGIPFVLTVANAKDDYENDWSGIISVSSSLKGGVSPNGSFPVINDIQVTSGSGQANQTLVRAESGVELKGEVGSVSQTVSNINVNSGNLVSLIIRDAPEGIGNEVINFTMDIGQTLDLYSEGYDTYGNYRGAENVNWTSVGLYPTVDDNNKSNITFEPTKPGNGTITVRDSETETSTHTGTITVLPGNVSYFKIDIINTQVVNQPFIVNVTAYDSYNNISTNYNGTVDVEDLSGSIQPIISGNFINGIWNGAVTIINEYSNNAITVSETGGGSSAPNGTSCYFDVLGSPGIRIVDFKPLKGDGVTPLSSVTSDQNQNWYIKMIVENMGSNYAILDSIKIDIRVDGEFKDDYDLIIPENFIGSNSKILSGMMEDSLMITVDSTGYDPGSAVIQGFLYVSRESGKQLDDHALTAVKVETPADLIIDEVIPSQEEVTEGQDLIWKLAVVLKNRGESDVLIDSVAADVESLLTFSKGSEWEVDRPDSMYWGGWVLDGLSTDTLIYKVQHTGEGETGECDINASIKGSELNTGILLSDNTDNAGWGEIIIERDAELKIIELTNIAPNAPYVNTGQEFDIRIGVANTGGDGVHDVKLSLTSEHPLFGFPLTIPINAITGGDTVTVIVHGTAPQIFLLNEVFVVSASGISENINESLISINPVDDTTSVIVQQPASLEIEKILISQQQVMGGQTDPWDVKVVLINGDINAPASYYAGIELDTLKSRISFWNEDLQLSDYSVESIIDDIILQSGERDTLIYRVNVTGLYGGEIDIKINVFGREKNSGKEENDIASTSIKVKSNPAFRIVSTKINTFNSTEGGNGYLDTGQEFSIIVSVENGLSETVQNINVHLNSEKSVIEHFDMPILVLTPLQRDSVSFFISADDVENLSGEKFYASITKAERGGSEVPVGPALDSTAVAYIQSPASLSMDLELSSPEGKFSTNQIFSLTARLVSHSSGDVDTTGKVRITLPSPYTLVESHENTAPITLNSPAVWYIKTPEVAKDERTIDVTLYKPPLALNTGRVAAVTSRTVHTVVTTHKSSLTSYLYVDSPSGARDHVLSSSQYFVVKTILNWSYVKDLTAQIFLPTGYSTLDNLVKRVISNEVTWHIRAPDGATSNRTIYMDASGYDALQDEDVIVSAEQKGIEVRTEKKSDLSLSLRVDDNSVSPEQKFKVYAEVYNKGEADTVGVTYITIEKLPAGYTTLDSHVRKLENGKTSWNIQAPNHSTNEAVNISAFISEIPDDENTSEETYVSRQSASIGVTTVGTWLSVSEYEKPDSVSSQAISGSKEVWLTALEMVNRGGEGSNGININKLKFNILDFNDQPIAPSDIFKEIKVFELIVNKDTSYFNRDDILGVLSSGQVQSNNPINIIIDQKESILTQDTSIFAIVGSIAEINETINFKMTMPDSTYILATDEYVPYVSLPVLSPSGGEFEIKGNWKKQIISETDIENEDKPYLLNFPNPFGDSENQETTIVYYLKKDTNVDFRIYSLIGKLVWSKSFNMNDPEGRKGLHSKGRNQIAWDGLNGNGYKVLNGVYILIMETGYGDIAKTKIAVVK